MQVNHAHVYRSSSPAQEDNWGNRTDEYIHKEFLWLGELIKMLQDDSIWSKLHPGGANGWTALLFVDYAKGREPKVVLEMKPSGQTLRVPVLPLNKSPMPTMQEMQTWVITNLRRLH